MPALLQYDCLGVLSISGVSLNRPAWSIMNLERLWQQVEVRGEDRLIPGVNGVIAYRRRVTTRTVDLDFAITGDVDQAGNPVADGLVGLETNLDYLYANAFEPLTTADGTRPATLTKPSGATRTANVHVTFHEGVVVTVEMGTCGSNRNALMQGVVTLTIPTGRFA